MFPDPAYLPLINMIAARGRCRDLVELCIQDNNRAHLLLMMSDFHSTFVDIFYFDYPTLSE